MSHTLHVPPAEGTYRPTANAPIPGGGPVLEVIRLVPRRYLLVPLATMLLAVLIGFVKPVLYTSRASFIPVAGAHSGVQASLASQFGLSLPGSDPSQNPEFYVDLLTSESLLRQVLGRRYAKAAGQPSVPLLQLLDARGKSQPEREDDAIRQLRKHVSANANSKTSVVSVEVRASTPYLAQELASELLNDVDRFNNERRMTSARAERRFTQARLDDINAQVSAAEQQLLDFRQHNRHFSADSPLNLEQDGLQRRVGLLTQLQSTIAQSLEKAQLDEVRDTPLISIVETPTLPFKRDSRGIVRLALTGALAGLMLVFAFALALNTATRRTSEHRSLAS